MTRPSVERKATDPGGGPRLILSLLGPFGAMVQSVGPVSEQPLPLKGNLLRALISHLAMQPGMAARRGLLASVFWPNADAVRSRLSLRQSLFRLRQVLVAAGLDILDVTGDTVQLRAERVLCDALTFQRLSASENLIEIGEAADLYRGRFLEDVSLQDDEAADAAFDGWRQSEAWRLENAFTTIARQLIVNGIAEGQASRTLDLASRLVAVDPFVESSQQLHLRSLWRFRGRSAALRQADDITQMFQKELGCEPEAETRRLIAEIRASTDAANVLENLQQRPLKGPSIAVLPFQQLDDNPRTELFSQGLTEDVTTALSRMRWLAVIASSSTDAFRGRALSAPVIAGKLGVRYLLEGTARTSAGHVRVTVKLVDAESGANIWAQRYDRDQTDIFLVQDDITDRVAAAIEPGIYAHEGVRVAGAPVASLTSWELVVRAIVLTNRFDRQGNAEARLLLAKAVELSPRYPKAHAVFAWALLWAQHAMGGKSTGERSELIRLCEQHAQIAIELDHDEPWAHMVHGFILSGKGRHREAITFLETAIDLNPSFALARMLLGWAQVRAGNNEVALEQTSRAMELSPTDSFLCIYKGTHGLALLASGRFEEALPFLRQSITPFPEYMGNYNVLISCCGHLGLVDEARQLLAYRESHLKRVLTIANASERVAGFAHHDVFMDGLRKAGVPETLDMPT